MSQTSIEVREIAKKYRLGRIGFTSLRAELERWWSGRRGRPLAAEPEDFWALRDVSFDVAPGEIVGIIGGNGAGKSTMLKILSEITEPTAGEIRLRGQVASLLEVGTGFHPELSGRDNIFLNGATLGMKRAEIRRKFDEIVAFAGVEKFLDTPVKRYSSGMYVRLAFAVAAHLEPDILLVDEVLAVGDHAFQQKCLGKMEAVARHDGRTVLFVSHNMSAVSRLCHRAMLFEGGRLLAQGAAPSVVDQYLAKATAVRGRWHRPSGQKGHAKVSLVGGRLLSPSGAPADVLPHDAPVTIELECEERDVTAAWVLRISLYDQQGHELWATQDIEVASQRMPRPGATLVARCRFASPLLKPGVYTVGVSACELAGDAPVALYEEYEPLFAFEISAQGYAGTIGRGLVRPNIEWSFAWRT
ncbi:MAG TPA: ABC transporter ATP-binding protein [Opitutaceae bacterium]|nr:ABC transporter ATP-binding protein [Opitutaceae bacterium]